MGNYPNLKTYLGCTSFWIAYTSTCITLTVCNTSRGIYNAFLYMFLSWINTIGLKKHNMYNIFPLFVEWTVLKFLFWKCEIQCKLDTANREELSTNIRERYQVLSPWQPGLQKLVSLVSWIPDNSYLDKTILKQLVVKPGWIQQKFVS